MILILAERPPAKASHLILKFSPPFPPKVPIDNFFGGVFLKNLSSFLKTEKKLTVERLTLISSVCPLHLAFPHAISFTSCYAEASTFCAYN